MLSTRNTIKLLLIIVTVAHSLSTTVENCFAEVRPVVHFGFDETDKSNLAIAENSVGLDGVYHGPDDMFIGINDIPIGVFGRAASFGLGDGYVSLPQTGLGGKIDSLESFSIMAWVDRGPSSILGQFGDSFEGLRLLTRNQYTPGPIDSITFYSGFTSGAAATYFSYTPILDDTPGFQHVAVTYSPEYARLYLNAELIVEHEVSRNLVPSGQDYFIGGAIDRFSGGIGRGDVDELWIYEGVLSQSQIRHVYQTNAVIPEPKTFALLCIFVLAVANYRRHSP